MDLQSIENNLLDKIKNKIAEKSYAKVPFSTFVKLWEPSSDSELTTNLIRFKTTNELDYVIIIDDAKGPQFVKFWLSNKESKYLDEGEDAVYTTGEEASIKQNSEINAEDRN